MATATLASLPIARGKALRLASLATGLGLAGMVAACGGGDSSSTSSTAGSRVNVQQTIGALRSSGLGVCSTTQGGEAPGIRAQAASRLNLDCPQGRRAISVFSFDDPNVAFAVAGGGLVAGDDVWLVSDLTVAGVALTPAETRMFDRAMRSLGAHRYQGA